MSVQYMYGGISIDAVRAVYLTSSSFDPITLSSNIGTNTEKEHSETAAKLISLEKTGSLNLKVDDLCFVGWRLIVIRGQLADVSSFDIESRATTNYEEHICVVCEDSSQKKKVIKCLCIRNDCPITHCSIQIKDDILGMSSTDKLLVFYTDKGSLWCISNIKQPSPEKVVLSDRKVRQVSCGKEHVVVSTTLGQVYTFGGGSRGQLGHGSLEPVKEPRLVEALSGVFVASISTGGWHTLVLSDIGDVYTWGWNESGQVGVACLRDQHGVNKTGKHNGLGMLVYPSLLFEHDEEIIVVAISCGTRHSAAVTDDGQLYTWGWNYYGQLFLNSDVLVQDSPRLVAAGGKKFSAAKCGGWSTFAFFADS